MSHVFTMMIDGDRMTAIYGANGRAETSIVEASAKEFRLATPPSSLPVGYVGCPPVVMYSDLSMTFDADGGLHGHGSGLLMTVENVPVTMSLAGVPDTLPPVLTLQASGNGDLTDPFNSLGVVSSEPVPGQPAPLLTSAGGDVVPISLTSSADFTGWFGGNLVALLRYGEQYRVDISNIRDLAGNDAVAGVPDGLVFTTAPVPPLVAPDGFESVSDTTFGGAQVLSAAGDPIISGTRSLFVPPPALGSTVLLALRLTITPGDSAIRFKYRSVNPISNFFFFNVASVGGVIWTTDLDPGNHGTTTGTIGGSQVTLGPVTDEMIPVPPGASEEIFLHYVASSQLDTCLAIAPPPLPGIIIDDLRVE